MILISNLAVPLRWGGWHHRMRGLAFEFNCVHLKFEKEQFLGISTNNSQMIVNYLVFGVNKLAMPTHLTLIKRMKHVYLEWWMRSISRKVWIYNDEMPGTNPQAFHATQYNELQRLIFHSPIITAIVVKLIFVCLSCLVKWKRLRLCESKCRNIILIRSIVKIKTPTIVAEFWNFCWFILGNKNSLEIPFIACRFKGIFLLNLESPSRLFSFDLHVVWFSFILC